MISGGSKLMRNAWLIEKQMKERQNMSINSNFKTNK
jgi:hypothetical protein